MAAPVNVRGTQVVNLLSKRRFLVQWVGNPETDVEHYDIYRSESQFTGFVKVGSVSAAYGLQFLDTVPFTFVINFFWKVVAVNTTDETSDLDDSEAVSDVSIGRFDEEPFKQTTVQKTDIVTHEPITGDKDGVNVTFTSKFLFRPETLSIHINGLLQDPAVDYTINTATLRGFTFLTIVPIATDSITLSYVKTFSDPTTA